MSDSDRCFGWAMAMAFALAGCHDPWGLKGKDTGANDTASSDGGTDDSDTGECGPDEYYCGGDGDVWARDCWGEEVEYDHCPGECEQEGNEARCCVSHDHRSCVEDSVFWYDDCYNREETEEDCTESGDVCYEGECVASSCEVYVSFSTDGSCDGIEGVWFNSTSYLWYDEPQPKRITWAGSPGESVTIDCTGEIWPTNSPRDCLQDITFTCRGEPYYYTHRCND